MQISARDQFIAKLRASLENDTFVKFTLSQPHDVEPGLRNIYGRLVELREGKRISFLFRYATRDITKNLSYNEAISKLEQILGTEWERSHLFTSTGDWQLRCDVHGNGQIKAQRPTFTVAESAEHDRRKVQVIDTTAHPWLHALGVTNASGEARPGMTDKLRQIQRFVELLRHLLDDSPLSKRTDLRVADMGAGKGYLTFAIAQLLRQRGVNAEVVGVEIRPDLVEKTNRIARETGFENLRFEQGTIGQWKPAGSLDVLIALHACNTATDDALYQGITSEASLIVTAPCCHKELRPQLQPPSALREVLRHGILIEREAEILTDGIRALLLEIQGYRANVFEFISPEHTGKNLMIAATRRATRPEGDKLREQFRELMSMYGIREQHLAKLLNEL
ncbi:class I SAM-dependent methyltransferase [Verrucomicrobiota bacterium sgz303538]